MIRFIVARYYLWRCPFNGKRLKNQKAQNRIMFNIKFFLDTGADFIGKYGQEYQITHQQREGVE